MFPIISTKLKRVGAFFGIKDIDIPWFLHQVVVPVLDVAPYVKKARASSVAMDLRGAGFVPAFLVPEGKRWSAFHTRKDSSTGSTSLCIQQEGGAPEIWGPYQSGITDVDLYGYHLDEGTAIGVLATGNPADGAIVFSFFWEEEEA